MTRPIQQDPLSSHAPRLVFGSKADTLAQLARRPLRCVIPPFDAVRLSEWNTDSDGILKRLTNKHAGWTVAVRSSAVGEDGAGTSHAGAFCSLLNVDGASETSLRAAVDQVFASYPDKSPDHQVIVQKMVEHSAYSGVILTRCIDDGSPYYVLNYDEESGRTDSITGGTGRHKTVLVYRKYEDLYCDSPRVRQMLELAREVEGYSEGMPLDMEFAVNRDGESHLLQVRRISTAGEWHPDIEHRVHRLIPHVELFVKQLSARRDGLYGGYTILGNMPDWNPAEMIGVVPLPLAASLYRHLITAHAWSVARMEMGYRRMPRTELMVQIGGRPYIDVRASFNSFLPEGLSPETGEKLVTGWLDYLADHPGLHDKVEFGVACTIMDFTFDRVFLERYGDLLNAGELSEFKDALVALTHRAVNPGPGGSLDAALQRIERLASHQQGRPMVLPTDSPMAMTAFINGLLEEGIRDGTIPFSIIARHAFIAEILLRSAVARNALTLDRLELFKSSFHTIMGDLASDTAAVCAGTLDREAFHERYGHLRPGTYDILSPCYRDRADLFAHCRVTDTASAPPAFVPSSGEKKALGRLLEEAGIRGVPAEGLFEYARRAIQGREYAKFIFTRNLSSALESIAHWGAFHGLGREDLAHLHIEDILDTGYASVRGEMTSVLMDKVDRARMEQAYASILKLSHLIRGVKDVHVVPVHRSEPNFITRKRVEAASELLQAASRDYGNLQNRIICIENADPGFDWIFAKGISGLITKYGGANSHMAIRCAELQLPAAIGCGEELFERLKRWRRIELDCAAGTIRSVDAHG